MFKLLKMFLVIFVLFTVSYSKTVSVNALDYTISADKESFIEVVNGDILEKIPSANVEFVSIEDVNENDVKLTLKIVAKESNQKPYTYHLHQCYQDVNDEKSVESDDAQQSFKMNKKSRVITYTFSKDIYNNDYWYFLVECKHEDYFWGNNAYFKVKNPNYSTSVRELKIDKEATIEVNSSKKIDVAFLPYNTTDDKTLTWISDNPEVATVDTEGVVTALSVGYAKITASLSSGINASCTVNCISGNFKRLVGSDRYKTSFLTADALLDELGVDKFDSVIVSSGKNFADALAGSYLAATMNAPMLMIDKNNTLVVCEYIASRLKNGGNIYVLGGSNAVPSNFESKIKRYGKYSIKRLAGQNRYETNIKILNEVSIGESPILVCTGTNFADSLSASATGLPILLVEKNLTDEQINVLNNLSSKKIYIIGGENAVSSVIENELLVYGDVTRLAGETRYDTSVLVAKKFFDEPNGMVLAYGQNFPDGLSGGSLAHALKSPLILTNNSSASIANEYSKELKCNASYVLGGSKLVSNSSAKLALSMVDAENFVSVNWEGYDPTNPIVQAALNQLGSHDLCSEVVHYSLQVVGLSGIAQIKEDGVTWTVLSPETCRDVGTQVSIPLPGDIAYYEDAGKNASHVAIYIGNGNCLHGNFNGVTKIYKAEYPEASKPTYHRVTY